MRLRDVARVELGPRNDRTTFRRNRIDIVKLVTDEPYAEALSKYLAYRMR